MNYSKQLRYTYYKTEEADFETMLEDVLNQLPEEGITLRLVCWCAFSNNEEYERCLSLYRRKVRERFMDRVPGISLVAQPPLGCGMILEVHDYVATGDDVVFYKRFDKHPYVLIENNSGRFLFASGFHGSGLLPTAMHQAEAALQQLSALIDSEGFTPSDITRQWNYIERITGKDGEDQRYQSFNNARADYYAGDIWTNGYPAATGVGTALGGVCIDLDAAMPTDPSCVVIPIDNRLQVAAHAYSDNVIYASAHKKKSPKFERAKMVELAGSKLVYISGTAAIRGEESLEGIGLVKQLEVTLENIAQLTQGLPLRHIRVYLKNPADYEEAERILSDRLSDVTMAFFQADVCRDALLIEIDGVAKSSL